MGKQLESTQAMEPGELDDPRWITMRKASEISGISVPWLHQLAGKNPSPFTHTTVKKGRIRMEVRIWQPSLLAFMRSREAGEVVETTEEKVEDWGRQRVPLPA